ncbi:MAG TPA: hypothetical protein VHC18_17985 [Amycolatopsis sp.]|nr:hypothetical protein [Amycolatopsis sp.]
MLQTDGLNILIAWAIFFALLGMLAFVVLRHGHRRPLDRDDE